jgi:hypothetical protein
MKKILFGLLLTGGFLMAEQPAPPAETTTNSHLNYWERIGLATQSPHVVTRGKENRTKEGYRIVKNKTTVVAYIPWGK